MHAIIMLAEIVGLAQLAFQFDLHFAAKPILTMMVTNAVRFILSKGQNKVVTESLRRNPMSDSRYSAE